MTKEFAPHEQRVVEEKEALGEKICDLEDFMETPLWSTIDPEQRRLLRVQIHSMMTYFTVLKQRIELF